MRLLAVYTKRRAMWNRFLMLALIGFVLSLIREFFHCHERYYFFLWNLFLALIPLVISSYIAMNKLNNAQTVLLWCIWLLMLPNAPYIVSDLVHLRDAYPQNIVLNLSVLMVFIVAGFSAGVISIGDFADFCKNKGLGTVSILLILLAVCSLVGIGIYLGRDLRLNSYDLILNPKSVFEAITSIGNNLERDYQTIRQAMFISGLLYVVVALRELGRMLNKVQSD